LREFGFTGNQTRAGEVIIRPRSSTAAEHRAESREQSTEQRAENREQRTEHRAESREQRTEHRAESCSTRSRATTDLMYTYMTTDLLYTYSMTTDYCTPT